MKTTTTSKPRIRPSYPVLAGVLAGLALLALSLLVAVLQTPAHATPPTYRTRPASPFIIAHRGDSATAPENTLPAMRAAARVHADMVEFDVQRTSDGHLIVVHDTTFARTTNIARVFPQRVADPVGSFTLAQVQRLDAGSWKAPRYTGTRVPTLGQLLSAMRPTRTNLLLELKHPELYPGNEAQVAQELDRYGYIRTHRVYVHSFSASSLTTFHRLAPSVPVGLISENGLSGTNTLPWLTTVNPTTGTTTAAVVKQAATRSLMVFAWPSRPAQAVSDQVERLVDDGVEGIITNNPAATRRRVTADEQDLRAAVASAVQRVSANPGPAR